jgi:hypothetical protein
VDQTTYVGVLSSWLGPALGEESEGEAVHSSADCREDSVARLVGGKVDVENGLG